MSTTEKARSDISEGLVRAKEEVIGVDVKSSTGENLGEIYEIVLEKVSGHTAYAVLESGTFLGLGGKLHAIPWNSFYYDANEECYVLKNVDKEKLKNAPSFDKDNWPDMSDKKWDLNIHNYYGAKRNWE